MNLDDLMEVWKSQDTAPLHRVDKTLLHLALRQDEAKLQKKRRRERWIIYVFSAGVAAVMAFFLAMMIYARGRKVMTGWDFVIGTGGTTGALLAGGAMFAAHRAQARREQGFGESLRDQLNRRIAQLDDAATRGVRTGALLTVLMGVICPTAIIHLGHRINQKSFFDDGSMAILMILTSVWLVATSIREIRRQAQDLLPRKRRLEALLKELDEQG